MKAKVGRWLNQCQGGQKRYSSGLGYGRFGCSGGKGGAVVASFQPADYKLVHLESTRQVIFKFSTVKLTKYWLFRRVFADIRIVKI